MFTKTLKDLREKSTQHPNHDPSTKAFNVDVVTGDYDVFRYDGLFSLKNLFLALNQKMDYKTLLPLKCNIWKSSLNAFHIVFLWRI